MYLFIVGNLIYNVIFDYKEDKNIFWLIGCLLLIIFVVLFYIEYFVPITFNYIQGMFI